MAVVGIVLTLVLSSSGAAQISERGFLDRVYTDEAGEHRYSVFIPQGEPPEAGWPVVLFLHGAGERGTDGVRQTGVGLGPSIKRRADTFPAVVVFPQADYADGPILETWRRGEPGGRLAMGILGEVEKAYSIDPQRRTVTGWSMGGYGALALAAADPGHWSKAFALAGGGEREWASALARLPVWLVHGVDDAIVPVSESRAMAAALAGLDHQTTLSDVASADHGLWRWIYEDDSILDWMTAPADAPLPVSTLIPPEEVEASPSSSDGESAFNPVLVISRALSLRLGNDAIETIVEGLPELLAETGISGTLKDLEDQVEFDDRTFDVRFGELSYNGRLHRAILGGRGPGRMQLSFSVRDFELQIGRIEVSDSRDGVTAGPVKVIIGHREPVWLDFEVRPRPSPAGGLQLELLEAKFSIPDHNWYVKSPEKFDIRGELFTQDVVRTAIVGGVYVRKALIEEQVLSAAPDVLAEVERQVDFSPLASLVTALWPLPVYSPQVQVRLEETSTDAEGVSLVFGCAVSGFDGDTPSGKGPVQVIASAPAAAEMPKVAELQGGVSLEVIGHLSALVAGSDAAQLYAADVPGRPFRELNDVAAVLDAVAFADSESKIQDVRSQLLLTEPFSLRPIAAVPDGLPEDQGETVRVAIDVPGLSLKVFQHRLTENGLAENGGRSPSESPAGEWSLLAERDLSIRQPVRLTVKAQDDVPTALSLHWGDDSVVRDRIDAANPPVDAALESSALTGLFQQGWARWAANMGEAELSVPDIAVGSAMLRLDDLFWEGSHLTAGFRPSATILVNNSDRSVRYRIRGTHSRWSPEQTIRPHRKHVYRTGSLLHIRPLESLSPAGQPLSLGTYDWQPSANPAGEHWVRRIPRQVLESGAKAASVIRP